MITKEKLLELGYAKKEVSGTLYFEKGKIILVYRDNGVWEFCANQGNIVSGGMVISTFSELNELTKLK